MRIVRFLYCLCALLVSGTAHLSAALPAAGNEHPATAPRITLRFQSPAEPGYLITQAETDEPRIQYFFSDESEDEDSNELRDGNFGLVCQPYSERSYPSYAAILRHPGNCFYNATSPVALPEARYILLGVLRI